MNQTNEFLLEARGLIKEYKSGPETVIAADSINLKIKSGEFVVITGPSGSGKTTLLNLLASLDKPDRGELYFKGKRYDNVSDREKTMLRRHSLSIIFQSFELIPVMSCYDNIAYPLTLVKTEKSIITERIRKVAEIMEIEELLHRKPAKISGGQKQRVAVARALVMGNDLILGDEITGNLDQRRSKELFEHCRELCRKERQSFLMVTHDLSLMEFADRGYLLVDGKLEDYQCS